jgi:protein SCO1
VRTGGHRAATVTVAGLLLLAAGACAPAEEGSRFAAVTERVGATLVPEPYALPDVTLTDQAGRPFELPVEAAGKVTLIFFGYTHCPDICPITMASVAAGLDRLEPAERERVLTVFVTLDPPRDDPARLARWLGGLDPSFVGLTGSQEQVDGALARLGFVMPPAAEMHGAGHEHGRGSDAAEHHAAPTVPAPVPDYEVAHPTALFVFTPEGLGRFAYPSGAAHPEVLAADLRTMLAFDW